MYLDNNEAILFRLLTAFFGRDKVIPLMSVAAACEGRLTKDSESLLTWARQTKCLFTVVNEQDSPSLVVELGVDNKDSFDLKELDKQDRIRVVFKRFGIPYIVLSKKDLAFVTDPNEPENLYFFLKDRFEDVSSNVA